MKPHVDEIGAPTPEPSTAGKVSWRRAAVMAVPAAGLVAAMAIATAQGALAVQMSISGMPFEVTADELQGQGFEQYGALDNMVENSPNAGDSGGQKLVVVSEISRATLTNLCQSVNLGGTNLLITAGAGSTPVSAEHLTTDSDFLSGDTATFNRIEIGNDASTLSKAGVKGPIGVFGQQADSVTIRHLKQNNYATTAAVFKLPGLKLRFSENGC